MFDTASERDDYYKLIAQKIYRIRKELEDRQKGVQIVALYNINGRCWNECTYISRSCHSSVYRADPRFSVQALKGTMLPYQRNLIFLAHVTLLHIAK